MAVNNITEDIALVARFFVQTKDNVYYATYTDGEGFSFDGCAARCSELVNQ
jgi:hypothetical protein